MSDFLKRVAKLPADRLALLATELKDRLDKAEGRLAQRSEPIAIVGMGCRFPGRADDPDGFWTMLRDGFDAVREVPPERWDAEWFLDKNPEAAGKMVTCRGGFLETVDQFDARFFGIAPREAVNVDPQHRLLLEVTWEALEDAGIAADRIGKAVGGVFIGLCNQDYAGLMMERPLEAIDNYSSAGAAGSMAAGRIAYLLGLSGPALTVDTACSSSLVALHLACESLRNGECRFAITGGSNLILGVESMIALSRAQMLSPDGRCSTFDESANGIVRGEGCGVVVLKRLSDAMADGDRIHALIRATGINQDGRSSGITAPNGSAQESLMRATLERCGLEAADIDYVEAHGTGTRLGDPIEVRALGEVYGARDSSQPLRLGSVKTNIGHLEAAAGIAGILKVVLALRARQIPPHLHLRKRNKLIEWDRWPLEIVTELESWEPRAADGRRRAAVSSFGFSGTNAHAILEEAPPQEAVSAEDGRAQVLPLAARSEAALRALAVRYADRLEGEGGDTLAGVCHTAATGRARFPFRVCAVGDTRANVARTLRSWARGEPSPDIASGRASSSAEVVFLFTGQGAQHVDMARDLYESSAEFRQAFDRCDESLRPELEVPLREVVFPTAGQPDRAAALMGETQYAQPALFAIEYALAETWRAWGLEPAAVAGHSVGEFAAAVVAGVLPLEDALRFVALRGRLMQSLPAGGSMAAIMAGAEQVEAVLSAFPAVAVAGLNSPANTVISGPEADLSAAVDEFARQGTATQRLVVSHAFHSAMMNPVLDQLEQAAAGLRFAPPEIPFFSTLTGGLVDEQQLGQAGYWRAQARRPVLFEMALREMKAAGHKLFLEVGPHATLSGLGAGTLGADEASFVPSMRRGQPARATMLRAVSALHVRGIEPAWSVLIDAGAVRVADLPTYPFERSRYWIGWSARAHGEHRADGGLIARDEGLLWRREWVPAAAGPLPAFDPVSLGQALAPRGPELVAQHEGELYTRYLPKLDELCSAYIVSALRELGVSFTTGSVVRIESLHMKAGVSTTHARLLRRMFDILAIDGLVVAESEGEWRVVSEPPAEFDRPGVLLDALQEAFPACAVETEVTGRCGTRLADVLTGKANGMDLLFPGGSLEFTERLYAETPSFRVFNTLVAEAVAAAAQDRASVRRRPRILEVGAGTGGTTSRVLPMLRGLEVEYVFTDVSPLFLERARQKLAGFEAVEYRLLDIGRDPAAQGFETAGFDIVVASNVLHATSDLKRTLANVRQLLAPGGLLVVLEGLKRQRFGDLTVGLTEGWWSFSDTDIRPDYALLDRDQWLALLAEAGYEEATVATDPDATAIGLLAEQGLLLARAPVAARPRDASPARWLAIAHPDKESGRLARALGDAGLIVEQLSPAWDVPGPDSPDPYTTALESMRGDGGPVGVLHLLSLDETTSDADSSTEVLARQARSTGSALRVAQAIAQSGDADLVYVTRTAVQVDAEEVDPAGAPLWGLRRSVAMELPELACRTIDLPFEWEDAVSTLAEWLVAGRALKEDEIAVRDHAGLVARITPYAPARSTEMPPLAVSGSYIITGGLAGLGLLVADWLARSGAARLVLCGRSDPSATACETIARLRKSGVDVQVVRGDVADPQCVASLVEAAGADRLQGVMHCAGITADATLLRQDWSHFQQVMDAKVEGAWNLHLATRDLPGLRHFVLFSTGAAFLGSSGQANHGSANAFMSGLACYRRASGMPGLAIDWGAWTEIGAATRGEVLERAKAIGLGALDPDTGLFLLERLMSDKVASVAAFVVDWSVFLERHAGLAERGVFNRVKPPVDSDAPVEAVAGDEPQQGALVRQVMAATAGNRRDALFDGLHDEAAHALGIPPGEAIDPTTPLTELGLDSLMAVELRNALAVKLDVALPATLLFTYPTLSELATFLLQQIAAEEIAPAGSNGGKTDSGQSLEALDEVELEQMLEGKLGADSTGERDQ